MKSHLCIKPLDVPLLDPQTISCFHRDRSGRTWIAGLTAGIVVIDSTRKVLFNITRGGSSGINDFPPTEKPL